MTHKNAKYHDDEDYYYMVKDEITTTKYLIHSQINAKGFVEKKGGEVAEKMLKVIL